MERRQPSAAWLRISASGFGSASYGAPAASVR
jgi:hypothetical protein